MSLQMFKGRCDVCRMAGLLIRKAVVPEITLADVISDQSEQQRQDGLPIVNVCVTCADTPGGCISPNTAHRRLPAEEYK